MRRIAVCAARAQRADARLQAVWRGDAGMRALRKTQQLRSRRCGRGWRCGAKQRRHTASHIPQTHTHTHTDPARSCFWTYRLCEQFKMMSATSAAAACNCYNSLPAPCHCNEVKTGVSVISCCSCIVPYSTLQADQRLYLCWQLNSGDAAAAACAHAPWF